MGKYYSAQDVLDLFERLSPSQALYGRLLVKVSFMNENEFAQFEAWVEEKKFTNDLDVILEIET